MSRRSAAPTPEFIATSLRRCPAFSVLSDADVAKLTASTVAASLPAGEVIYRQGDPAAGFYLVAAGAVRLVLPERSQVVGPGQCFGELDVLEDSPRAATAIALERLTVVAFDRADFEMLLLRNPDLLRHILESLDAHIQAPGSDTSEGAPC